MAPNTIGRIQTEEQLRFHCRDFSAAYMAVKYLATHIRDYPETVTCQTVEALASVLESERFAAQKQVLFLYSEAADAMVSLACQRDVPVSRPIVPRLQAMLPLSSGKRLQALGQSLGKLPVRINTPAPVPEPCAGFGDTPPLLLSLPELLPCLGHSQGSDLSWAGRSLIVRNQGRPAGVVKFARSLENISELRREARWLACFASTEKAYETPEPVSVSGRTLFKLPRPLLPEAPDDLYDGTCIAYIPCDGYYDYPNESSGHMGAGQAKEIFFKNARQLGAMTAVGRLHTALIPLFHNRVQQGRRNDNGAYLWEHGGRLDQWLDSCSYPNFARSGLRDFEHLISVRTGRKLRHYIGEHLLSFILVIGSYFRNQAPDRRGKDSSNTPCDTRDLFCPNLFERLVTGVSQAYFEGLFNGSALPAAMFPVKELVSELIRAMGRDDNMEEVLRIRDQESMGEDEFEAFLRRRGITDIPARGAADITLETGPHLGGFNQTISTPGLIDYLFRYSAFCVSFWFKTENRLNP